MLHGCGMIEHVNNTLTGIDGHLRCALRDGRIFADRELHSSQPLHIGARHGWRKSSKNGRDLREPMSRMQYICVSVDD
jgi:hypothetical protein